MQFRSAFGSLVFVLASVLNPAYFAGCGAGGDDDEFHYGAEEMQALLETANGRFETETDGRRFRVELALAAKAEPTAEARTDSPWSSRAFACGQRQLYATAAACGDFSTMALEGEMTLTELKPEGETTLFDGPVRPQTQLEVYGLKLSNGEISIVFEMGSVRLYSTNGQRFDMVNVSPPGLSRR